MTNELHSTFVWNVFHAIPMHMHIGNNIANIVYKWEIAGKERTKYGFIER